MTTVQAQQAHAAIAEIVREADGVMVTLDYQDGCQQIPARHTRTIGELISAFDLRARVQVWEFDHGFVAEIERKPEGLEHWNQCNLQHRPGRLNRHHMAILMVLGVRWVEFGVTSITVGL